MGEGFGNEELLMPYISSCSIACGGHFGSADSINKTLQLAKHFGVKVGAHPAYPDPENFGRKSMKLTNQQLKESLEKQLNLFIACCKQSNSTINHIKPHGAFYNDLFHDSDGVLIFINVILEILPQVEIYCAPGSLLESEALKVGLSTKREGFMDRSYNADGTLRSRLLDGAVLTDFEQVGNQVVQVVKEKSVPVFNQKSIPLSIQTLCLHGDNPKASDLIKYINQLLKLEGIEVQ
tara:strand:+ start:1889 stop:2596 length:708 start_codon:yes stop_codon:yes gene_type:complete